MDAALDLALAAATGLSARPTSWAATTRSMPALVVEDDDLRRPAVGEVGDRLRRRPPRACVVQSTTNSPANSRPARSCAARRAPALQRRPQRVAAASQRPPARRASSPATPSSRRCRARGCVSTTTRIRGRVDAQLRRRDLARRRCGRPGPSRSRSGTASRCRPPRGAGPPGRAPTQPVADAHVLDAAGDPRVARARGTRPGRRAASPRRRRPAPSRWPGPEAVADVERVAPADLPAVDADPLGEHCPARPRCANVGLVRRRSRASRRTAGCSCRPRAPRRPRSGTR